MRNLSRLLMVSVAAALLAAAPVAASSTRTAAPATTAPAAATLSTAKVAIIVGPTESATANYKSAADAAYGVAIQYTSNVVKVYSPGATWTAVQAAVAGASIVIYLGHGNGWPSPYPWDPTYATKDGFGLNDPANLSDSVHKYYGEPYVSTLQFAPNAVVLLNHLCYASGNSEPGNPAPTLSVAEQRVDNYGAGFLKGGAQAVIAEGHGSLGPMIAALFTAHESVYDAWRTMPDTNGNTFTIASTRTPGATAAMDPDLPGSSFYRSFIGSTSLTTDNVIAGAATQVASASASASASAPGSFVALAPARLLDSRVGNGLSGAFTPNAPRAFQVSGRGGVPADAIAVTGNLTATKATAGGYVSLTPELDPNPTTSTINFPVGDTRANGVTVTLGAGGTLAAVYKGVGSVQLIFDVTGYFVPNTTGATFVALAPARLLDSRVGNGLSGAFTPNAPRAFQVSGRGGVPADAIAVTGNLTATKATAGGYVSLTPELDPNPTTSTINFPVGDTRANGVTVTLGAGGTLAAVYKGVGSVQLIFDVTGYYR